VSAIELRGVGKRYTITSGQPLLVDRLRRRSRSEELWALRDVDLSVAEGETVGVIGRNGSGKTTLLRLLSGVSGPTTGRVRVVGAIAPLIGVGVGFHPEMTGRENVHVNARLLGLTAAEVTRELDSIVDFSEIERFLDTPVKYYSSGMFLRLAFAVAVHVRPQVLLVDEVLAVGDLAFQLKCLDRMREVQQSGTTIVIVTHNLQMLDRMAPRGVLLSQGRVAYDGPVEGALSAYHRALEGRAAGDDVPARLRVELLGEDGTPARHFPAGGSIAVDVTVELDEEVDSPVLGVMVAPLGLGAAYAVHTTPGAYSGTHGPGRPLTARVELANRMLDGSYSLHVGVHDSSGGRELGASEPVVFYVSSEQGGAYGIVDLEARISMEGQPVLDPGRRRLG
jgi:ABC-2 type transport system ATP-binding protein